MADAIDLDVSFSTCFRRCRSACSYVEVGRLADVVDVVAERQTIVDGDAETAANVIGGVNVDANNGPLPIALSVCRRLPRSILWPNGGR